MNSGRPTAPSTKSSLPITLGPEDTGVEVSSDGTVSTSTGIKGRLQLVDFPNETVLDKSANSLFVTDVTPQKALTAEVVQGMIEGSNVEPIVEVSNMITALRSYQSAQEVILGDDGLLRQAIDVLTDQSA